MTVDISQHWQTDHAHANHAQHILQQIFRNYLGSFHIKLWDDRLLRIGDGVASFTLTLKHAKVPRDLVLYGDPVRLAEAYFEGAIEVDGDFNSAMGLRYYLENLKLPLRHKLGLTLKALRLSSENFTLLPLSRRGNSESRQNNLESIAFHYDVSNDFYKLWLDDRMVYSCGYFDGQNDDLEIAQCAKLDHICRKLRLQKNETLLDIGCGWGALICWAASRYGVTAHGITLSRNQYEYASQKIEDMGLKEKVIIEYRDYRTLPQIPRYDKISSVGMFEHIGLKNLPEYFSMVRHMLKPGGLFLNHGITSDEPGWRHGTSSEFINRHVFPDGELDTISNIQKRMEIADLEILDVEGFRAHYAMTLRHWVHRLEQRHEEIVKLVGERTYRIWRLYMTGCAIQFELGSTGIYQILASGKESRLPPIPLTRRDLYQPSEMIDPLGERK